jgi:threonine dehydratase
LLVRPTLHTFSFAALTVAPWRTIAVFERVALAGDAAIVAAQQALWDGARIVAEPGAAAPFAALVSGAYVPAPGERVGVVVCGANTTAVDFSRHPAA